MSEGSGHHWELPAAYSEVCDREAMEAALFDKVSSPRPVVWTEEELMRNTSVLWERIEKQFKEAEPVDPPDDEMMEIESLWAQMLEIPVKKKHEEKNEKENP